MSASSMHGAPGRPLLLVSWQGPQAPLPCLHLDAAAEFDWLLFDYTGTQAPGPRQLRGLKVELLSERTECKGDIYNAVCGWLHATGRCPEYVGLLDDDILIAVSDINRALHIARCEQLDVFSPTLLHDSHASHRFMLSHGRRLLREVDWVEVMMPFYRGDLLLAAREHIAGNVSSWGLDRYLFPALQRLRGQTRTALLDAVTASHRRAISSGQKIYRNGMSAKQEMRAMRERAIALLQAQQPELLETNWFRRLFLRRKPFSRWQQLDSRLGRPLRRWLESV